MKVLDLHDGTLINEVTATSSIIFMASSLLSFLSMRTRAEKWRDRYEIVADGFFLIGLSMLFVTTMLISFNFVG